MSTIPELVRTVSNDIQETFDELIKLVIRKTVPPAFNRTSAPSIFNPFTGLNEPGLVVGCNSDLINKYTYRITNRALGWTDDQIISFRMTARFANSTDNIYQAPRNKGSCCPSPYRSCRALAARTPFPAGIEVPSDLNPTEVFKYIMENIFASNYMNLPAGVTNPKFDIDATYSDIWKQLNSIGVDIINQTDISILPEQSARMSTAMLRARLYNLEMALGNFARYHAQMYDNYIAMVTQVNSLTTDKLVWLINLIGALSFQRWEDINRVEQAKFIRELGADFIKKFECNQLITILIQSGSSELILTASYLYPLQKMLFVVFGFNQIEPIIENLNSPDLMSNDRLQALQPYFDRNAGARLLRAQVLEDDDNASVASFESVLESLTEQSVMSDVTDISEISRSSRITEPLMPLNPNVYEFVRIFCSIYPTITSIMGGCNNLPDENRTIVCSMIPRNYNNLCCIYEFLWRYFDYSYCKYINHINSRIVTNVLKSRINSKVRYLQNL